MTRKIVKRSTFLPPPYCARQLLMIHGLTFFLRSDKNEQKPDLNPCVWVDLYSLVSALSWLN